jgi:hypothetical protein
MVHVTTLKCVIFGAMCAGRGDFYGKCVDAGYAKRDLWKNEGFQTVMLWGGTPAQNAYMDAPDESHKRFNRFGEVELPEDAHGHGGMWALEYSCIFTLDCIRAHITRFQEMLRLMASRAMAHSEMVDFPPMEKALHDDDVQVLHAFMQVIDRRPCKTLHEELYNGNWMFRTKCMNYLADTWSDRNPTVSAHALMVAVTTRDRYEDDKSLVDKLLAMGASIPYYFAMHTPDRRWMERLMATETARAVTLHVCTLAQSESEHIQMMLDKLSPERRRQMYTFVNPGCHDWQKISAVGYFQTMADGLQLMGLKKEKKL